jgi:hypothetical protein
MEKLEQLKKEMLDAKEAYDTFKTNNSRELTEEEKRKESQHPTFISVKESETRVFELTKDNIDEMRKLEQNMRDTHSDYVSELKITLEFIKESAKKYVEGVYYKVEDIDDFNGEALSVYNAFIKGAEMILSKQK